ncbi:MAG: DUF2651 family protein [Lysinibacillus sp.]
MNVLVVMFILPLLIIIASILGYIWLKQWTIVPLLTFILFTILTFTLFNDNFFIWAIIYTIISLITSLIMCKIRTLSA